MTGSDPILIPPALHELESEVMAEVCGQGRVTARAIFKALNARNDKQRAYTIMQRLGDKGLLCRWRQGKTDVYEACMSRDDYLRARAEAEVGALVEQYGDAAVVHFARRTGQLDPDRRHRLSDLAHRA